ncbi:hypothetical protein DPX16_19484 [Anabarilius grahami]|uniref:Uncharacterized protein n=1 Tax=Anabarilius grahami TaxID=495550 RepID=A0A3N0Z085_ANAGA|nr:hypothetical protein DPX16_19484 [Anabarilius grahami]
MRRSLCEKPMHLKRAWCNIFVFGGEPPIPWPRWLQSFETYLIVASLTEVSASRKKSLLQHCLGAEGQRVLGTICDSGEDTYEQSMTALNVHFAAPQSVLLRWFVFCRRHQLPGESMHQYVANLRGLANSCKFGGLRDEMIRNQLIEHTNDNKIRETLLLQPDDLTLSRAIVVAFQVESAAECVATLTNQNKSTHSQLTFTAADASYSVMQLTWQQRRRPQTTALC